MRRKLYLFICIVSLTACPVMTACSATTDEAAGAAEAAEENDEGDEELPPGVSSINKTEKVVIENGVKKRITKIIKVMEDGAKQIETTKEVIDE